MKRARETGFVPVDGVLRRVHRTETFDDDDPLVLAHPTMFVDVADPRVELVKPRPLRRREQPPVVVDF